MGLSGSGGAPVLIRMSKYLCFTSLTALTGELVRKTVRVHRSSEFLDDMTDMVSLSASLTAWCQGCFRGSEEGVTPLNSSGVIIA